jgi:hypothetical protein
MMEQDYICSSEAQTAADLSAGPGWFAALDEALGRASEAGRSGVDLQLCMMNPAHALASTTMRHASNGRGTGDHVVRNAARGLPLGWSGMLLWAVGLWPSRDNVWTNSSVNVPGLASETDPAGQTAMAVLAGGPYGVADIAGALNKSLLMQSCRDDGVLLRPDKPATAVDHSWVLSFDDLKPRFIWGTFSQVGSARWSYVLSLNLDQPVSVPMATLDESSAGNGWVAYESWHGVANGQYIKIPATVGTLTLPATPQVDTMTLGHSLWVIAPVLPGGWVFVGEEHKLVAASRRRLKSWVVLAPSNDLQLTIIAAPTEVLNLVVLPPGQFQHAARFSCVAGDATQGKADAFGDIDLTLVVTCATAASSTHEAHCAC